MFGRQARCDPGTLSRGPARRGPVSQATLAPTRRSPRIESARVPAAELNHNSLRSDAHRASEPGNLRSDSGAPGKPSHMSNDTPDYGGFPARAAAWLIDWALIALVTIPVLVSVHGTAALDAGRDVFSSPLDLLINALAPAAATIAFWVIRQATPGKLAFSLRVVDARTGGTITVAQGIVRYLGYIVSAMPLGLGFLWVLFDEKKQGWHDKLAQTVVLVGRPAPRRQGHLLQRSPSARGGSARSSGDRYALDDDPELQALLAEPPGLGFSLSAAAIALALHGVLALAAAVWLRHADRWTVSVSVLALAVAFFGCATALLMRKRAAWVFSLVFFALSGIAYLALCAWSIRYFVTPAFPDWGVFFAKAVAMAVIGATVVLGPGACALAVGLLRARSRLQGAVGDGAWKVPVLAGLAPFLLMGWTAHELHALSERCSRDTTAPCLDGRKATPANPSSRPAPPAQAPAGPVPSAPVPAPAAQSGLLLLQPSRHDIRPRLEALMPTGCRLASMDANAERVIVDGHALQVRCVSEFLRALADLKAQPQLVEVRAAEEGGYRFTVQLTAAALHSVRPDAPAAARSPPPSAVR